MCPFQKWLSCPAEARQAGLVEKWSQCVLFSDTPSQTEISFSGSAGLGPAGVVALLGEGRVPGGLNWCSLGVYAAVSGRLHGFTNAWQRCSWSRCLKTCCCFIVCC